MASTTALIRRFHDASRHLDLLEVDWNDEAADPDGGPVICHNDLCLETVVFCHGQAVALLDFDFAAPGRPVSDVARFVWNEGGGMERCDRRRRWWAANRHDMTAALA